MKILVNNKERNLTCVVKGIDCSNDVIGNNIVIEYSTTAQGTPIATMTEDEFIWWEEYLGHLEADEAKKEELVSKYGDSVYEVIYDHMNGVDMEDEHAAFWDAVAEIESEENDD